MTPSSGHTVLVVPIPELEAYVRARTLFYDASFLSVDPAFVHSHLTLLGPWLPFPSPRDLATVAAIVAGTPAFDYVLSQVAAFPDGLIHLRADDPAPFAALTRALAAAFPQCPPYGGAFPDPVPHVTLDRVADGISIESARADLNGVLPARGRATRVDLQWWANDDCRVLGSWQLS
jgi:hypothetical protein